MKEIFVLLVEDEPTFMEMMKDSLEVHSDNQFIIDTASSAYEAIDKIKQSRIDVIVSDYSMPEMTGLELFKNIREYTKIPFILFTGKGDEEVVIDAINVGVDYYLKKGADYNLLFPRLSHMIRQGAERKFAEETIQEREHQLRDLFEKSLIATLILNTDGRLIDCNNAALTLLGLPSKQNIIGKPVLSYQNLTEEQSNRLKTGGSIRYNAILNFKELSNRLSTHTSLKEEKYIDVTFIPQHDSEGLIIAYYVQIIDLTPQYIAETALRKSNEQLGLAIEGSQLGLWDWYIETGVTIFNERWAEIIGYTLEELKPTSIETWINLTHPDDLEQSNIQIGRHIAGEIPYYECIARMKHKDGRWVYIHDRGKIT